MDFPIPIGTKIYNVSELNFEIKSEIENTYSNIWIEGEISNFAYPNKKHMYFSLVDEHSMIKVAMFENNCRNLIFNVEDGLHVYVNGYVSIYDKRSEYQIIAYNIIPVKKGSLMLAFEQLKEKLQVLGFFNEENKKPIPQLPLKIGVITSKSGAVIRDIVKILNKRYENYHLILRNTTVQGSDASKGICAAIDDFEEYCVDVIIIARGGGSFEDLAPFNDEELARKIFNCSIPIISGVGHQTDFTICDFVADKRAATPTHAAELAIVNKKEETLKINKSIEKLFTLITQKLSSYKKELKVLRDKKVFKQPKTILNSLWQEYDDINADLKNNYGSIIKLNENKFRIVETKVNLRSISARIISFRINLQNKSVFLKNNIQSILNIRKNMFGILLEKMNLTNPVNILSRGFSIVKNKKTGKIIKSINDINIDEIMSVLLRDGLIDSKVIIKKGR
ncbi:exodeoxyribonuclease VII large subunit [bacterium]|nr:exodeoxyribonuclease VII large subunit [bacterium]